MRPSKVRNPWTASSPLVVPEKVRMASAILASVSIAGRPSAAPPSITPPEAASWRRLVLDAVGDVLHREAKLVGQRPDGGEFVSDGGVVPLDDLEARHGLARYTDDIPALPVPNDTIRLSSLAGSVVLHRDSDQVMPGAQVRLGLA